MARKWLPDNVTEYKDRHGKRRYRFRKRGLPTYSFKSQPGTEEFRQEYAACLSADKVASHALPFTYDALIEAFYKTGRWQTMRATSRKTYSGIIENFRAKNGGVDVRRVTTASIEAKLAAMVETPSAANNLRKVLARLHRHAIKLDWRRDNPVDATDPFTIDSAGWHPWSDDEIAAFEERWPLGTRERLAKELLLETGLRKSDMLGIGPANLDGGKLRLRHGKNRSDTVITMTPELAAAIEACPSQGPTFLVTQYGKPYTSTGFYNWFKRACVKAGLPHCPPHGLRKALSRQLAESGATPLQGRAVTGHKTDKMFAHYAASANQAEMAEQALANRSKKRGEREKRNG